MPQPRSTEDLRDAARAVDALKRGETVCLEGFGVCAAEGMSGGQGMLALSAARSTYLHISKNTPSVLEHPDAALLEAALFAPALPAGHPAARAANSLEQAAIKLVQRAGFLPAAFITSSADPHALTLSLAQAEAYLTAPPAPLTRLPEARLPLAVAENARVIPFQSEGATHLALLIGTPETMEAPLVRLHSSCLTGDLLGSLRCDCGDQLQLALERIAEGGGGVLLYLDQEGRGIGLAHKLRAYALQDAGCDTVEANHRLGFEGDERDFSLAARMLKELGIGRIRLLTNNPAKVDALVQAGVAVTERIPLTPSPTEHNRDYLATKRRKLSHYE